MAEIPKRYFERFFVLAGFAFIAFLFLSAYWMLNARKLQLMEEKLAKRFVELNIYRDDRYFPDVKILGPKGNFVDILDSGGKFTVLNIWKTSCKPCLRELLSLSKLSEELPYDLGWRVVAISIDGKNDLPKLAKFVEYYKIGSIASYNDYNLGLQKNLNVSNLPVTLILNKHGRIIYQIRGAKIWHDKTIIDFLGLVNKVY